MSGETSDKSRSETSCFSTSHPSCSKLQHHHPSTMSTTLPLRPSIGRAASNCLSARPPRSLHPSPSSLTPLYHHPHHPSTQQRRHEATARRLTKKHRIPPRPPSQTRPSRRTTSSTTRPPVRRMCTTRRSNSCRRAIGGAISCSRSSALPRRPRPRISPCRRSRQPRQRRRH